MKSFSFWAKNHPRQARWLIAFGRFVSGTAAVLWGIGLGQAGLDVAETAFQVSAVAFLLAFAAYPFDLSNRFFVRRKCCDALLVVASLAFWLGWGNWREATGFEPSVVQTPAGFATQPTLALADVQYTSKMPAQHRERLARWSWQFRKDYRAVVTEIRARRGWEMDDWMVLGGAIAFTILALLLAYVVLIISCNLSCNGQEGAALVVGILGAALVLFILIWTWRWAALRWRRNRRDRQVPDGARRVE